MSPIRSQMHAPQGEGGWLATNLPQHAWSTSPGVVHHGVVGHAVRSYAGSVMPWLKVSKVHHFNIPFAW